LSFISSTYVVFFTIVVMVYFALSHRFRWGVLLVASYIFYGYWNITYTLLILFSTTVDYVVARQMANTTSATRRRVLLGVSLVVNLGLLATFKYYDFVMGSTVGALAWVGVTYMPASLGLLLPVGISFYTFQSMGYTIDVYRGRVAPERHFGIFATFISFFPQLVAGPIERAENMLPQFRQQVDFDDERAVSGVRLIFWGVVKKVVIADRLAIFTNVVYSNVQNHSGWSLVLATLMFGFQIYMDFSAYTDIARGSARVLGFELMENFRQPYLARSVRDFWRRWHISLSTWFRDYLYIPLGGSRVVFPRYLLNLFVVFVVSGLWHGATWNYVIWGALHGGYMVVEVLLEGVRWVQRIPVWIRQASQTAVTFFLVMFAWIFFASPSAGQAFSAVENLFTGWSTSAASWEAAMRLFNPGLLNREIEMVLVFVTLAVVLIVDVLSERVRLGDLFAQRSLALRWAAYYSGGVLIGFYLLYSVSTKTFIYFQF
jgi:alginate O-acetyltransferase complex protein AlgI